MKSFNFRHAEASDYQPIISVINEWWGGRNMADMLPKLFFVHFRQTSFVSEKNSDIIGFVIGFVSQTFPQEAYIHFMGVHPEYRRNGLGSALYERFFQAVKELGCNRVSCVTSPMNKASVKFHLRVGFSIDSGEKIEAGISVVKDYDGRGEDRVLFSKILTV
jgi:ribosomal protein S18 acetylase RimI-like enzyme